LSTVRGALSLVAITLILLLALGLPYASIPADFLRYVWWSTGSDAVHGNVLSQGVEIHFTSYGSGEPILLLHGGLSNRLSWFSQLPWLVEAGRRVIVVDTRGHGGSGLGRSDFTYHLLAKDAIRVLDALGIERTDVIGWSDGGNIALQLARDWPRRVRRIVAISANFDPSGLVPEARRDARTTSSGTGYWLRRVWTEAGELTGELERRVKRLWRTGPTLTHRDLHGIQAPVLVIGGERDMISLEHTRRLAALLPHAELRVIPGGGHATPITQARQVNQAIARFLRLTPP
jgi:pimeloyl-ACP methyl ester carboxylesterase